MASSVFVNGKFLNQPVSGVQHYAHGILSEIKSNAQILSSPQGRLASNYWEQQTLPSLLKEKGSPLLLSFCNSAPAYYKNQIVTIHDMAVHQNAGWFQSPFTTYYKLLFRRLSKNAKHFVTVSEFSKAEIMKFLNIPEERISVIHSAVGKRFEQQLEQKPSIGDQQFVLMVGSHDPRKNFDWVIKNAGKRLNELGYQIIVVGRKSRAFAEIDRSTDFNAHWLQDCTDSELKWLYRNAALVIHPALYEGFSLVPLEALSLSGHILISDIPVHREIVGERATYFDLDNVDSLIQGIELALHSAISIEPLPYSFETSARQWDELIARLS